MQPWAGGAHSQSRFWGLAHRTAGPTHRVHGRACRPPLPGTGWGHVRIYNHLGRCLDGAFGRTGTCTPHRTSLRGHLGAETVHLRVGRPGWQVAGGLSLCKNMMLTFGNVLTPAQCQAQGAPGHVSHSVRQSPLPLCPMAHLAAETVHLRVGRPGWQAAEDFHFVRKCPPSSAWAHLLIHSLPVWVLSCLLAPRQALPRVAWGPLQASHTGRLLPRPPISPLRPGQTVGSLIPCVQEARFPSGAGVVLQMGSWKRKGREGKGKGKGSATSSFVSVWLLRG